MSFTDDAQILTSGYYLYDSMIVEYCIPCNATGRYGYEGGGSRSQREPRACSTCGGCGFEDVSEKLDDISVFKEAELYLVDGEVPAWCDSEGGGV
jgi:hypothetical protein